MPNDDDALDHRQAEAPVNPSRSAIIRALTDPDNQLIPHLCPFGLARGYPDFDHHFAVLESAGLIVRDGDICRLP
jgi:hypothetical protein